MATVMVLILLGGLYVPMPALTAMSGLAVPIALLAPLGLSTVVGYGLTAGDPTLESVAARPIRTYDTIYATGAALITLMAGVIFQAAGLADLGSAAGRNAVGFVGFVILARAAVGPFAAPLFPAGLALFCAFFGGNRFGEALWWAWMLAPASDERSWAIAGAAVLLGAVVELSHGRRLLAGGS